MEINLTGQAWGMPVRLNVTGDDSSLISIVNPASTTEQLQNLPASTMQLLQNLTAISNVTVEVAVAGASGIIIGAAITGLVSVAKDYFENKKAIKENQINIYSQLVGEKYRLLQLFRIVGKKRGMMSRDKKILELAKFEEKWWENIGLAQTLCNIPRRYILAIEISENSIELFIKRLERGLENEKELDRLINILEMNIDDFLDDIKKDISINKSWLARLVRPRHEKLTDESYFKKPSDRILWILTQGGGKMERNRLKRYARMENTDLMNALKDLEKMITQDGEIITLNS